MQRRGPGPGPPGAPAAAPPAGPLGGAAAASAGSAAGARSVLMTTNSWTSAGPSLGTSKTTDPAVTSALSGTTDHSWSATLTVPPPAAQPATKIRPMIGRTSGRARRTLLMRADDSVVSMCRGTVLV